MTKSQIRSRIKLRLDEDGVYRTNSQIDALILEASLVISVLAVPFRKSDSILLASGVNLQTFPDDFFLPLVLSISGARVFPTTPRSLTRLTETWPTSATGTPIYYFPVSSLDKPGGVNFWVHPAPNAALTLSLDYVYVPPALLDGEEPPLPKAYHQLYEDYGVYRGHLLEPGAEHTTLATALWTGLQGRIKRLRDESYSRYQGTDFTPVAWEVTEEKALVTARI